MKKLLAVLLCLLLFSVTVHAEYPRLVDNADLLSSYEEEKLTILLDDFSETYDCDIAIYTTYDTKGMSIADHAALYNEEHYSTDSILLCIGEWFIDTSGKAITNVTDYGIDSIEDAMIDDLSAGNYYRAFRSFVDRCSYLMRYQSQYGEPYDDYRYDGSMAYEEMRHPIGMNILTALVFGFIVALIVVTVMKSQLKSVRMQAAASNYVKQGSFSLDQSKDIYLYRNVKRTAKPKDTGGYSNHSGRTGGGSTVRMSPSGHSHGGRGGRF